MIVTRNGENLPIASSREPEQDMDQHRVIIDGVAVDVCTPEGVDDQRPALLFVHGGFQGSWCWQDLMPFLAARGWSGMALNWFGRHGSHPLNPGVSLKRSLLDVTQEVSLVANTLARPPILVGHSMGGLVSLAYASQLEVAGLVLLAPVVPASIGARTLDVELDLDRMWGPPPFEMTQHLFFSHVPEARAREYHQRLVPESPVAVEEATQGTAEVDLSRITAPSLVMSASGDLLVPSRYVRMLAERLNAPYTAWHGKSHAMHMGPGWQDVGMAVSEWLATTFPAGLPPEHPPSTGAGRHRMDD